ncbi:zinc ABC transporter ATP-binding protein ZnuC [Magnetospira sp. QH-2]|uniref:zinc ABC transporter ATP-binding protein ZnuC n=1 Tax=Magnetospira sp. (strain QH-2) TaxID=1288970 RepID=UPI0003E80B5C|nr:zinc ABC transporter ATP-binding protein ZnuC [Magnetospira sp. QH-2]CCQ74257.1 Zinc import ATP-binding protein znuC; High-affinity zinc uptake system membrane protein znuB znuC [Magnetospira sp. QH-2]
MRQEALVLADGISVSFSGRLVLERVSVAVNPGQVVTLVGPNGAGKTTLVRCLLGLMRPDSGSIVRRSGLKIGYMPQKLEVDETLPLTVRGFLRLATPGGSQGRERIKGAAEEVGITRLLDAPIQSVSGGEMQRVLLARAMVRQPDLLVLDEPVQGVDINGQAELYALIAEIRKRHGCGVLMVSHDLHLVMASTDEVVCLNTHVCCSGHPEAVSRDPAFVSLFGEGVASSLALYHHRHDHAHDMHGNVVPLEEGPKDDGHG